MQILLSADINPTPIRVGRARILLTMRLAPPLPHHFHALPARLEPAKASFRIRLVHPAFHEVSVRLGYCLAAGHECRPGRTGSFDVMCQTYRLRIPQGLDDVCNVWLKKSGIEVLDPSVEENKKALVERLHHIPSGLFSLPLRS